MNILKAEGESSDQSIIMCMCFVVVVAVADGGAAVVFALVTIKEKF